MGDDEGRKSTSSIYNVWEMSFILEKNNIHATIIIDGLTF